MWLWIPVAFFRGLETKFSASSITLLISSSHVLIYKKDKVDKRKPTTISSKNTNWRHNIMTKSDVLYKDLLFNLVWTWTCNLSAVESGFCITVLPSCHNNGPPTGGPILPSAQLRIRFSKLRRLVVAVNKFQISLNHFLLTMTKLKAVQYLLNKIHLSHYYRWINIILTDVSPDANES